MTAKQRPWHHPEEIEAAYANSGNLVRAQIDYVRSVAQSFTTVLDRLTETPESALAKHSVQAAVLWATKHILEQSKTEAAA